MPIIATYINQDFNEYDTFDKIPDFNEYDSFDKIPDFNLVSKIICNNNKLTSLPDNMNYPNLQ